MRALPATRLFASLAGLAAGLLLSGAALAASAEMKIVDLSTNPPPEDILKPFKMDAVKKDKNVYFTDFAIMFATRGQWVAGGAGFNKEVSTVLNAELVGLDNDKLQQVVDEVFAYAQQKYGELFTVISDEEVEKVMSTFDKIVAQEPAIKQEQLRQDTEYLKGFSNRIFMPGNKIRRTANGVPMGVGMAYCKAKLKLAAMTIGYSNRMEFARIEASVGASGDGTHSKTAKVSIEPYLSMVGGGPIYSNTKIQVGMLQAKEFAGFPDRSWVKEVHKNDQGVWEIVVDPELHKAAALKLLKAHIDSHVAVVRKELGK